MDHTKDEMYNDLSTQLNLYIQEFLQKHISTSLSIKIQQALSNQS